MAILKKISNAIVEWLMDLQVIEESEKEFYQYGFQLLVSSLIDAIWVLFWGGVTGRASLAISYVLILITVRTQIGGFHASTYFRCFISYTLFFIISVILYDICIKYKMSITILGILILAIFAFEIFFSPVPHRKKLSNEERIQAKVCGIKRTSIWILLAIVGWHIIPQWSYAIVTVLCVSVALMMWEFVYQKIKNR